MVSSIGNGGSGAPSNAVARADLRRRPRIFERCGSFSREFFLRFSGEFFPAFHRYSRGVFFTDIREVWDIFPAFHGYSRGVFFTDIREVYFSRIFERFFHVFTDIREAWEFFHVVFLRFPSELFSRVSRIFEMFFTFSRIFERCDFHVYFLRVIFHMHFSRFYV